ncbi:MAG: HAD-IC family P-type ATPase [Actinomyces sp.]|nr:HAD-IC family P-type ATPase [Actinomyces sp.]MCI1663035.1 HAD-IC family P-type ATPase [Actinomyces sp.]
METGLTAAQVEERRRLGRTNAVRSQTSRSLASIARANLVTLFNAILLIAVAVVLAVGEPQDAVFGFVMALNAVIGILSEYRAARTLDSLAILDRPRAAVVRDGSDVTVPVADIVLDDVVHLGLGDQIPVDGTLLEAHGLEVDESLLTGESAPVPHAEGDRVLAGTAVVAGRALLRATEVGEGTYAQSLTRQARRFSLAASEIQQGTDAVLRVISWAILPVVVLMVWSQTRVAGGTDWRHALVLAVAGVVGMIPQGLVLLTSMNFALGSATLARRGVLVQELPAIEVLARVDALCVDKTGTLTTGGVRVRSITGAAGGGAPSPQARDALAHLGAPRDNATSRAIADVLGPPDVPAPGARREWSVAFSSARKWAAWGDGREAWALGAPEIVLDEADPRGRAALERAGSWAGEGLRVVALVRAPAASAPQEARLPGGRVPEALVVLEEELRADAPQALSYFADQGVGVRVISGDNPVTAGALARAAGLRRGDGGALRICDARTLPEDAESEAFAVAVESHDIFGRVTPEQKRAMVRALQRRGHTVAMTGDGVNDTLALKDADLGIAMGNGASATKAVAQVVLVGSEFSVLPGVVAEGRRILANMERVSSLFLAKTTYAAVIAVLAAVAGWTYPFLPRHFTYIDAFTIGIPAFVIALGPNTRRYRPGFLRRTLSLAVPAGLALSAAALGAYALAGPGTAAGQTLAALTLITGALWLVSITARPLVPWRAALLAAMAGGAVAGVSIPFTRGFFALEWPEPGQWLVVGALGAAACLAIEVCHRLGGRLRPGRPRRDPSPGPPDG